MKTCCEQEARKSSKRHDACGARLLTYRNERDCAHTLEELAKHGITAETATYGTISTVAKARPSESNL